MDATAFFAQRAATRRVPNASRRTPNKSTQFNDADNLERDMQKFGYTQWGFVIYRCAYEDDEQWKSFLGLLSHFIDQGLELENAMDMKSSLDYPIIEDASVLDSASPEIVWNRFEQWARNAPEDGQHGKTFSPRFRYCIFVDQEALDSVTKPSMTADGLEDKGFVNLLYLSGHGATPARSEGDGLKDYHMRVNAERLMLGWWSVFKSQGIWDSQYRPPPEVLQY